MDKLNKCRSAMQRLALGDTFSALRSPMKAYKYKLKTNRAFVAGCESTLNLCRELYNASLQERRDAYRINGISLNYHTQRAQLPDIKAFREDVQGVYSQVLQDVLKRSDKAFQAFFRRCKSGEKPGYPRFKSKDRFDSCTYPGTGFSLRGDQLFLAKIGSCRVRLSRDILGQIKTCTIKRECDGWYVIFTAETEKPTPLPLTGVSVGIDLGLETFATLNNGEAIENPRFFAQAQAALGKKQQNLSRKQRGSGRRRAAKKIVAQAYRKTANQRRDFAHKEANKLIARFDAIALEDLNVKGLAQLGNGKSIHDAGWTAFTEILGSKAANAGRQVVKVPPAYTSQDCSHCGHRRKMPLRVRIYECQKCKLLLHRDHNAAINILVRAEPRFEQSNGIPHYSTALGV